MKLRAILQDKDAYATTILLILIDNYGTEVIQWTPETIRLEIKEDYNLVLPDANLDKLMAAISILTTDDFFKRLPVFIQLCNILSGDDFDPTSFDPADPLEIAWGITEAMFLEPPDEDEPFIDEIRHYIGEVLNDHGITSPPDVLRIAIQGVKLDDPNNAYSDDPEMYAAMHESNKGKSDRIKEMLKRQIGELVDQIQALDLENGDTKNLIDRLGDSQRKAKREEPVKMSSRRHLIRPLITKGFTI
jgi:hypothetical protein